MNAEHQRGYAKGYEAGARRAKRVEQELAAVRRSAAWVLDSVVEYGGLTHDQIIDAGLAKARAEIAGA